MAESLSPSTPSGECDFPSLLSEYAMHLKPPAAGGPRVLGGLTGPLGMVLTMWHTAAAHPDGATSVMMIKSAIRLVQAEPGSRRCGSCGCWAGAAGGQLKPAALEGSCQVDKG